MNKSSTNGDATYAAKLDQFALQVQHETRLCSICLRGFAVHRFLYHPSDMQKVSTFLIIHSHPRAAAGQSLAPWSQQSLIDRERPVRDTLYSTGLHGCHREIYGCLLAVPAVHLLAQVHAAQIMEFSGHRSHYGQGMQSHTSATTVAVKAKAGTRDVLLKAQATKKHKHAGFAAQLTEMAASRIDS